MGLVYWNIMKIIQVAGKLQNYKKEDHVIYNLLLFNWSISFIDFVN